MHTLSNIKTYFVYIFLILSVKNNKKHFIDFAVYFLILSETVQICRINLRMQVLQFKKDKEVCFNSKLRLHIGVYA